MSLVRYIISDHMHIEKEKKQKKKLVGLSSKYLSLIGKHSIIWW